MLGDRRPLEGENEDADAGSDGDGDHAEDDDGPAVAALWGGGHGWEPSTPRRARPWYHRHMSRTVISTAGAPAAIGPYSQAIRAGNLVFCSGQIALDPASGSLVGAGDVGAQTRRVLDNLSAVLEAAGVGWAQVAKTTIYLADMNDFAAVNAVYSEQFGAEHVGLAPPARATVEVSRLPKDVRVEIDAIAVVD